MNPRPASAVDEHSDQLELPLSDPSKDDIGKFQRPGDAAVTQRLAAVEAFTLTGKARRRVLHVIARSTSGLTDEQIQMALEMNPSTQRPRRVELVEGGWIEDSGEKRRTRSGRRAVIWTMTDRGREHYDG